MSLTSSQTHRYYNIGIDNVAIISNTSVVVVLSVIVVTAKQHALCRLPQPVKHNLL